MRTRLFGLCVAVLAGVTLQPSPAQVSADQDHARPRTFSAALVSFNEVPTISSPDAKGLFRARLNRDGDALGYSLTFRIRRPLTFRKSERSESSALGPPAFNGHP